jgi:hypothetical protein
MTDHTANIETMSPPQPPKPGMETVVALVGTTFTALLLTLTAMYAGPLWRDEVNTANLAQMSSLKELWNNMSFESFPLLWPLLLRGCDLLGLAGSDASIRVLGLYVGLFFLASLWLCSRWMGSRAPILSVALLGSLPAFIFIVGANRAYGLASCLLVLSFGTIWRVVEFPSRARVLWAGLVCFLFVQCVYYDSVFLCAMLAGGAMVTLRRRQWKTLWALIGIGAVAGASMVIYLPIFKPTATRAMNQPLSFDPSILWYTLSKSLTAQSSARSGYNGPEVWLWIALLSVGSVAALLMQLTRQRQTRNQEAAMAITARIRADLALFCVASMILGIVGYMAFLLKLQFVTQTWYYVEMLCLCAISLDGMLAANWPALCPWGLLRIGFIVAMMTWNARPAWEEAHTRRSNVDLIAATLGQKASAGDLIVVESAWEGITFDRYYHGQTHWVTVPPINSHKVHRNDLAWEKLNEPDPMAPVLREITDTLRGGNSVWIVGNMAAMPPQRPPPPALGQPIKWWSRYLYYWSAQVLTHLLGHALQEQVLEIPVDGPVNCFENLPVSRFSGYKPDAD